MQTAEQDITANTAKQLGLTQDEFERINKILGRTPNFAELSVYSVVWSERCSHKNSIKWLKTLPREGKKVLSKAGEVNAGLVNMGDNVVCALKMKLHQSFSALGKEAAPVIGELHRDIFTKGARPLAAVSSLRFGSPEMSCINPVIGEVLKAIDKDCNLIGVPSVPVEVYFDDCYSPNVMINTLSVGLATTEQIISGYAEGAGNPVFMISFSGEQDGIKEGREDNQGFSAEEQVALSPAPTGIFSPERRLMEAIMEAAHAGSIVGLQDLGAAGLACATAKMCAKTNIGMRIFLDKVSFVQVDPVEILLSDIGGQQVVAAKAEESQTLHGIFEKWGLRCVQIGEVTDSRQMEFVFQGEKVAELPVHSLIPGGGAPAYDRDYSKPAYMALVQKFNTNQVKHQKKLADTARKLFHSPFFQSKRRMPDSVLHGNYANLPFSGTAVLPVPGTPKALAVTMACNPVYAFSDPFTGGMIAVAEAARNLICAGAVPVAVTHGLHFGDPYDPEIYYQFVHAIKGIGEACRKFETPVVDGVVSFFNQTITNNKVVSIYPTPLIGMVGLLNEQSHLVTPVFRHEGDAIYMLGNCYNDLGSSAYLHVVHGVHHSTAPVFDLHEEYELQSQVKSMIRRRMLLSAYPVSKGGLFVNLMVSALAGGYGFNIETVDTFRRECFLFGESQSRFVVTISPDKEDEFQNYLVNNNVSFTKLGEVFGSDVIIDDENFGSINEWKTGN
jgi:phosphoribosylformylglycinamidine synthase